MKLSIVSIFVIALLLVPLALCNDGPEKAKQEKKPKKPNFTISKETTYVLGPVMADGYIDNIAAMNAFAKEGVTTENNAMILMLQVVGPNPEGGRMADNFFKALGCERPPENGQYFQRLEKFTKATEPSTSEEELNQIQERVLKRPWAKKDFPLIEKWLEHNAELLDKIKLAMVRPRYFCPAFLPDGRPYSGAISMLLPSVQINRDLTYALVTRAMRSIEEKKYATAGEDIFLAHQLARRVAQGLTMIERLVGISIEMIALEAGRVLLGRADVETGFLRNYQKRLQALPPLPPISESVDKGERLFMLDACQQFDKGGMDFLKKITGDSRDGAGTGLLEHSMNALFVSGIPWDPGMKEANAWMDKIVAVFKLKEPKEIEKELNKLEDEIKRMRARIGSSPTAVFTGERATRSKKMVELFMVLLTPAISKVLVAEQRVKVQQNLSDIGFALEIYKREKKQYPDALAALVPNYVPALAKDFYSGEVFAYEKTTEGYRLYSFGLNRKDDQGRGSEDEPRGDDVLVEQPWPEKKKKADD